MTQLAAKQLLIVAHAPSPNLQRMLDAIVRGAQHEDIEHVEVRVVKPLEAGADEVLAADAIILMTPENLAYMSGALKDFFDRTYYPVLEEKQGLACALVVRAGHDGTGTLRALKTILTGLRWQQVQEPLLCKGAWDETFIEQCEELGMGMAAGLDAGIF
ncbi:flavodoxin family protein [Denitrificimonas caeni]|uniref:NAD(P)H-dependent oxidoreductase n=1 Tax=Denitrificimonas caeni TaxID=521720 RepID=A0AAF0ALE5_9GAMM|nr:NAD(P)H-dependent oxidoreductase [Denitrificimonas caeni]NLJ11587.1 flavodoxin family protein [Gammaproteobacteria bacterium]WBE25543.1 NAD(P)H-dependent oxidoreductase [Denitrificimonas caeni]